MDVSDWKENLLDGVVPKKNRDESPRPGSLREPFESAGAVMYGFCRGCGLRYELKADEAAALFSKVGEPYQVTGSQYFEMGSCGTCESDDHSLLLKEIQ